MRPKTKDRSGARVGADEFSVDELIAVREAKVCKRPPWGPPEGPTNGLPILRG